MSDWDGTHSTINAALNGLDQEQPDSNYFGNLKQAVQNGSVPQSRLDDMVHRILRAMFADGIFDHPATIQPIDATGNAAIAQEVEEQGAVLLKNSGQLPLSSSVSSIAVIGSHADVGVLSGGGSAQVIPSADPLSMKVIPARRAGHELFGTPPPLWRQSNPLHPVLVCNSTMAPTLLPPLHLRLRRVWLSFSLASGRARPWTFPA